MTEIIQIYFWVKFQIINYKYTEVRLKISFQLFCNYALTEACLHETSEILSYLHNLLNVKDLFETDVIHSH